MTRLDDQLQASARGLCHLAQAPWTERGGLDWRGFVAMAVFGIVLAGFPGHYYLVAWVSRANGVVGGGEALSGLRTLWRILKTWFIQLEMFTTWGG